jgi:Transketolase
VEREYFAGNYIHYGVREHAMCGIMTVACITQ